MQIHADVSLDHYSTMRLGGKARALTKISSKDDLLQALAWAEERSLPALLLGGGSNIIFANGYDGLVIINHIKGFHVAKQSGNTVTLEIGAGENWDEVVGRSVQMGLSGIEMLSLIPGTAGATPVQNVGAYGAEIAGTFVELEAYDLEKKAFVTLTKGDCKFGYRTSIFKPPHKRRYIITRITLALSRNPPIPPFYAALQQYLNNHRIRVYTPQTIREAVIAIRTQKLPDPKILPNTGSFFKNPIVSENIFKTLQYQYPDMPFYPAGEGLVKLAAGWLVETAGLKGYKAHGMRIYEKNALVFINDNAKGFADLAAFKQEVINIVRQKFGITLEQEPELIPESQNYHHRGW